MVAVWEQTRHFHLLSRWRDHEGGDMCGATLNQDFCSCGRCKEPCQWSCASDMIKSRVFDRQTDSLRIDTTAFVQVLLTYRLAEGAPALQWSRLSFPRPAMLSLVDSSWTQLDSMS